MTTTCERCEQAKNLEAKVIWTRDNGYSRVTITEHVCGACARQYEREDGDFVKVSWA